MTEPRRRTLRTPAEPVETDAVTVVAVGTALWALALGLAVLLHGRLADEGRGDWVWVAAAGVFLGLVGLRHVRRRRSRVRAAAQVYPSGDGTDPNKV